MQKIISHIRHTLTGYYPESEIEALTRLLCREVLGVSAVDFYLRKDTAFSANHKVLLDNYLNRLKMFEPIQYIMGSTPFCGLTLNVGQGVLVPRPETAELVGLVLDAELTAKRFLDIGTGSGCIALTLASRLPSAYVEAWDVSDAALAIARQNNTALQTDVAFRHVDVLRECPTGTPFDVIVSNPPYIKEEERTSMHRNVLDWEPEEALFVPDDDPLLFYRRIGSIAGQLLSPQGRVYFEINQALGEATRRMLQAQGFSEVSLLRDLSQNDRFIIAKL